MRGILNPTERGATAGLPLEIREAGHTGVGREEPEGPSPSVKDSPHKHEDLSSDPQDPCQKPSHLVCAWKPGTGKQIQAGPWGQRASAREHPIKKMERAKALCMKA